MRACAHLRLANWCSEVLTFFFLVYEWCFGEGERLAALGRGVEDETSSV